MAADEWGQAVQRVLDGIQSGEWSKVAHCPAVPRVRAQAVCRCGHCVFGRLSSLNVSVCS